MQQPAFDVSRAVHCQQPLRVVTAEGLRSSIFLGGVGFEGLPPPPPFPVYSSLFLFLLFFESHLAATAYYLCLINHSLELASKLSNSERLRIHHRHKCQLQTAGILAIAAAASHPGHVLQYVAMLRSLGLKPLQKMLVSSPGLIFGVNFRALCAA